MQKQSILQHKQVYAQSLIAVFMNGLQCFYKMHAGNPTLNNSEHVSGRFSMTVWKSYDGICDVCVSHEAWKRSPIQIVICTHV